MLLKSLLVFSAVILLVISAPPSKRLPREKYMTEAADCHRQPKWVDMRVTIPGLSMADYLPAWFDVGQCPARCTSTFFHQEVALTSSHGDREQERKRVIVVSDCTPERD